jgi:predicted protein tyrosine phosphatase
MGPKIRLEFDDIEEAVEYDHRGIPQYYGPTQSDIDRLIAFARKIDLDKDGTLLVHCYIGKNRSTAAAYIIYATLWGPDKAREAAWHMYWSQAPHQRYGFADPNRRMIQLASNTLGWDLMAPLEAAHAEYYSPTWDDWRAEYAGGLSYKGRRKRETPKQRRIAAYRASK